MGSIKMIYFHGNRFISKMTTDTIPRLLTRTLGSGRLIDDFVFSLTHDIIMNRMLLGIQLQNRISQTR